MKILRLLILIGAGFTLAACSSGDGSSHWGSGPTQWGHSQKSVQEQQVDQAECNRRASYQTEREMDREGPFANEQRDDKLQQMFDRHDQQQRQRQLYDNCLRDKGYVPIVAGGK